MEQEQLLEMIKDLLTERLGPVMERLEKIEDEHKQMLHKEEVVERDVAEDRDLERDEVEAEGVEDKTEEKKEEEKTEAMEHGDKEDEESKMEEGEEGEDDSELGMKYKEMLEECARLREELEGMKKESVMAEAAVAELKAEALKKDALHAVTADLADKPHLSQMSERLVDLYMNDKDLYADILNIKGSEGLSSLSQRSTKGLAPVSTKKVDIYEEAFRLQAAEGISYADAISKLTEG
jgi:hypothetical protein